MESEGQEPNPNDDNHHNDDDGREATITAFREITSATREEAIFFLEIHKFDLDAAVSTILDDVVATTTTNNNNNKDNDNNENANDDTDAVVTPSLPLDPESPEYCPTPSRSRSPSPSRAAYELRSRREKKEKKKKRKNDGPSRGRRSTRGNVRTLSDLKRPGRDESDSDESDEPQEYYTGGEKSGMLVQDPTRSNDVDAIFSRAKQVAIEPADYLQPSSSSKSFTGTARLLSGEMVSSAPEPPEVITRTITFWRNGFSVDDGPLRRLDDPENASFLESIKESKCPEELEPTDRRTSVHVDLQKRDENYPEPAKPVKRYIPFEGVGRTVGSSSTTAPAASEPTVAATSLNTAPLPSMGLVVDESSPSTSIQLRLADGTRMVSRFNHHHTIRDIRDFIDASRPGGARTYQLLTMGFPPKQLADLDQTIDQAGIGNSVVIQKF
ncbi:plant UBX domain-containing protein 4 [Alnus glutinosa]|uniref:plant UBX domain-containing protein 4 n=1 Tax=Alnus glutinosa TaxID=3517 RepID=UPI002D7862A5|nr:plant UBX domain-containing protein 4 [Alnus glutinosa]